MDYASQFGGYDNPYAPDLMEVQRKQMLAQQLAQAKPSGSKAGGIMALLAGLLAGRQQGQAGDMQKSIADRMQADRQGDVNNFTALMTAKPQQGAPGMTPLTPVDDEGNVNKVIPQQPNEAPEAFQARKLELAKQLMLSKNPQMAQYAMQQMMPQDQSALFGKVDAKDYTPESLAKFAQTKHFADLVPRVKNEFAPNGTAVNPYEVKPGTNMGKLENVNMGSTQLFLRPDGTPVANLPRSQSPDSAASNQVTMRGQNLTNARAIEGLADQRTAQRQQFENTPSGPMLIDKASGVARPVTMNGQAIPSDATQKKAANAAGVLDLLDQAEKLLPNATNSMIGAGADMAAKVVGAAPKGAQAIGQLKTIEGALLMQMPRMEGPQSNYDVQNYKEAAVKLGDPTTPNAIKQAAINAIREIQSRYKNAGPAAGNQASGQVRVVNW